MQSLISTFISEHSQIITFFKHGEYCIQLSLAPKTFQDKHLKQLLGLTYAVSLMSLVLLAAQKM